MISLTEDKRMLGYESLNSYSNIFHFVTTRRGGYSEGAYASFNCSHYSGDEPERVCLNRKLLLEALPQSLVELVVPVQTHGTEILHIEDTFTGLSPEQKEKSLYGIDALITAEPGYCICISTADCVPVLMYDRTHQAIAAVHAGWRGTVKRIVEKTLDKMAVLYGTRGEDVQAYIGPGISLDAFEVGDEVYEAFEAAGFDMACIARRDEKWHLDLWEATGCSCCLKE